MFKKQGRKQNASTLSQEKIFHTPGGGEATATVLYAQYILDVAWFSCDCKLDKQCRFNDWS